MSTIDIEKNDDNDDDDDTAAADDDDNDAAAAVAVTTAVANAAGAGARGGTGSPARVIRPRLTAFGPNAAASSATSDASALITLGCSPPGR